MPPEDAQAAKRKRNILIAVVVLLVAVGAGVLVYFHTADSRYAAKCQEAEKVTTDVRDFLGEIDDLKGDPDGDDVKEYLDRVDKASSNLDKLAGDLKSMRVSGKNEAKNQALVEAILLEKDILGNVQTVLKQPSDSQAGDAIRKVKESVAELDDRAGKLAFDGIDFAAAMQLDGLDGKLQGYVQKKQALDAQKKAEEERKAREAAEAKRQAIQKKLEDRNNTLMSTTSDLIYIATDIKRTSPSRLDIDGFFYNGTSNPILSVQDMMLDITLYKDGQSCFSDSFTFDGFSLNGLLMPHQKRSMHVWVNENNGMEIPESFDEFELTTDSIHWTYRR